MSWQALHAVSDKMTPRLVRDLLFAFEASQRKVPVTAILQAITGGGLVPAEIGTLLAMMPTLLRQATTVPIRTAVTMGGEVEASTLARMGFKGPLPFNVYNPVAVNAARTTGAQLVTNISMESRKAIQSAIAAAIQSGVSPRDTARLIQTMVGLTERQSLAVTHFRDRMAAKGASADLVHKSAARYAKQLLRQRSETIARTELMGALVKGQQALWADSRARGALPFSLVQRWIVTPDDRLCELCQMMEGQRAAIGEVFNTPLGPRTGPPMHPNCRCAVGLVDARTVRVAVPPIQMRLNAALAARQVARDKAQARRRAAAIAAAQKLAKVSDAAKQLAAEAAVVSGKAASFAYGISKLKGPELANAVEYYAKHIVTVAKAPQLQKFAEKSLWGAVGNAKAAQKAKASAAAKKGAATKAAKKAAKNLVVQPPVTVAPLNSPAAIKDAILGNQPSAGAWPIPDGTVRVMGRNYPAQVEAHARPWLKSLPTPERQAIEAYTGSMYQSMNRELRQGATRLSREVENVKAALRKAPAPPPPDLVWRGMRSLGPFADTQVGQTLTLNGFQSTTINPQFAATWGTYVLEVKPRAGGFVQPISRHKGENEFLLPHGATYRIVGRRTVYLNNLQRTIVQVEMIDDGA